MACLEAASACSPAYNLLAACCSRPLRASCLAVLQATGKELLMVSRTAVVIWGIIIGLACCMCTGGKAHTTLMLIVNMCHCQCCCTPCIAGKAATCLHPQSALTESLELRQCRFASLNLCCTEMHLNPGSTFCMLPASATFSCTLC